MRFNVLGALEVFCGGEQQTPTATRVRWTLALLLLRANQVVHLTSIIDELWGDKPPRSAVTTAQTYIYQLRKKYGHYMPDGTEFIETRPPGYLLHLHDGQLDLKRFEQLSAVGRASLAAGDVELGSQKLRSALELWRGPVLADLSVGSVLAPYVAHLEETRLRALQARIIADARLGRYRALIPELRSLVLEHPLNEWFHEQLVIALSEVGRRGDALQAYRSLQRLLREELGIEPSEAMRRLQRDVLTGVVRPASKLMVAQSRMAHEVTSDPFARHVG
jgi:SARP family transcriptional regulator, regulator of embCAB operon